MKKFSVLFLTSFIFLSFLNLSGQDAKYYPKGDPDQWNVEITPFLWLPSINGEMESSYLSKSFDVSSIDLLGNLQMAFMINAEVSKGKVFATPSYIYARIGTDKVVATSPKGDEVSVSPTLTMNIAGLNVGIHEVVGEKLIIDPYLGFRYNSIGTELEVNAFQKTTNAEEEAVFTDPLIGLRILYFPHPRVPIMFRTDVGGFGIGSDYSWTAFLDAGYTLSPQVDIIAGFSAYGMKFTGEAKTGNTAEMSMVMYGVNIGVKIMLPRRAQDPEVFKKFK